MIARYSIVIAAFLLISATVAQAQYIGQSIGKSKSSNGVVRDNRIYNNAPAKDRGSNKSSFQLGPTTPDAVKRYNQHRKEREETLSKLKDLRMKLDQASNLDLDKFEQGDLEKLEDDYKKLEERYYDHMGTLEFSFDKSEEPEKSVYDGGDMALRQIEESHKRLESKINRLVKQNSSGLKF